MWTSSNQNATYRAGGLFTACVCLSLTASDAALGVHPKRNFVLLQELPDVKRSDAQWADFDGDGDLDLVVCGMTPSGKRITKTYENDHGKLVFRQDLIGISGGGEDNLAWGDYDNDGDVDLAMAGISQAGVRDARIYANDGNGYLTWDDAQSLLGVDDAGIAWGDYDNDGDLDLVITGDNPSLVAHTILYRNEPVGTLTEDTSAELKPMYGASVAWADYDGDGDLDLLLAGRDSTETLTRFYRNEPVGTLIDDGDHGLPPGGWGCDAVWGDYDGDDDLDLAMSGGIDEERAHIYENDGTGGLTLVADLMNIRRSAGAWGDYDNDGDLDIALSGLTTAGDSLTYLFENTGGSFVLMYALQGVHNGAVRWADVDGDSDLDFLLTGETSSGSFYTLMYESVGFTPNTPPTIPKNLEEQWLPDGLMLSWDPSTDAETSSDGLYYCLRVGTTIDAHDVVSGTYGTPLMGNVGQVTEIVLDIPDGRYHWSVRAIDSGLMPSSWFVETCPEDIDDDLAVDVVDLLILLATWGPCSPEGECFGDLDWSGEVDVLDLLQLLGAWGPCP